MINDPVQVQQVKQRAKTMLIIFGSMLVFGMVMTSCIFVIKPEVQHLVLQVILMLPLAGSVISVYAIPAVLIWRHVKIRNLSRQMGSTQAQKTDDWRRSLVKKWDLIPVAAAAVLGAWVMKDMPSMAWYGALVVAFGCELILVMVRMWFIRK